MVLLWKNSARSSLTPFALLDGAYMLTTNLSNSFISDCCRVMSVPSLASCPGSVLKTFHPLFLECPENLLVVSVPVRE